MEICFVCENNDVVALHLTLTFAYFVEAIEASWEFYDDEKGSASCDANQLKFARQLLASN